MKRQGSKALILRGSLIVLKRRCGKTGCHCYQGSAHETHALSYSIRGKTGLLTLRPENVAEVKNALARFNKASAKLEKQARSGFISLRKRLEEQRANRRGKGQS